ncbi:MAG: molybdenum cofactor guanylyltransferase [Methyloprofundus sp.]|nr:molybdenum cofactor guanylyltransferase [Methyloprofundus sp.]
MNKQAKVSGVILAGGLARRMQQQDKGLVLFNDKPMIEYAIQAIAPVVDELFVNANRHMSDYEKFSYPVISDENQDFAGPLAGVYAALTACQYKVLLVVPCDSPFMNASSLQCLIEQRAKQDADIAVAFDGERIHPVFMAIKSSLKDSLQAYLASGERKIDRWFEQHHCIKVDLRSSPDIFLNINTLEQLAELDTSK